MSTNKYIVTGTIVALVLGLAAVFGLHFSLPSSPLLAGALNNQYIEQYIAPIRYNGGYNSQLPIHTSSTLTVDGVATFIGGQVNTQPTVNTSFNSTTTPASLTLQQSDLKFSTTLMNLSVGAITVTLPASSTLTTVVPNIGNAQSENFCNATTTSGFSITVAGNTGLNLSIATSTNTTTIVEGSLKCARITLVRTPNSDVDVLLEPSI